MKSRLVGALGAAALCLGLVASHAPLAAAATPDTRGLFGAADPTYDGVLRQSTAIMGLAAVGQRVPASAVQWLLRQQCADGSFASYRPDPAAACPKPDSATFTGPDTNSTAAAILALRQVAGSSAKDPARRALARAQAWLARQQTPGGGWEWIAGLGPDAVSTSMSIAALSPGTGKRGVRAMRWLARQVDVAADCSVRFQPNAAADPLSTAWAFIAVEGPLPYAPLKGPRSSARCPDNRQAVMGAGAWLADALITGNGQIPSAYDATSTDWNSTALATLGMSQSNGSTDALRRGLAALQANVDTYAGTGDASNPTALGTLLMVAHATKSKPRDFGGVDLTTRLLATLQA